MFGKLESIVKGIIRFLKEVRAELTKVTWPTRRELIGSTIVTVVVTLIISVFIGIIDRLLALATRSIFG
jgi:preprotein translocase subunit SecE